MKKPPGGRREMSVVNELKFVIPQETLTQTIAALRELALRLEIDASALALVNSRESAILAEERLEQAWNF